MPERVARLVGGQHGRVDRLPESRVEIDAGAAGGELEQRMINPVAGHRRQLDDPLRLVGERLDPDIQRIPQRVGHVDTAARRRTGQLLDEVRNPLAPAEHHVDHRIAGGSVEQLSEQLGHLGPIEVADLDAYGAVQPADLGQEGPQRMAAGQLVGAIAGDDHHRRVGQRPGQEAQQVPGRLVGPVDVLHDHHQRTELGRPLPQHGDGLEQLQPDGLRPVRRRRQVRQQCPQCGPARAGPFQHLVSPVLGEQVAEGTDHRGVRQTVAAQRHALAADQLRLAVGQGRAQVGDEGLDHGRLAGTRVAADDDEPTAVIDDVIEDSAQLIPLLHPADDVVGGGAAGRAACRNHRHHRATGFGPSTRF